MATSDLGIELTPEQEAEATRLEELFLAAMKDDVRLLARTMASKENRRLLGETEFEVRDLVHGIGAKAIQITVNERSKKGVLR